MQAYSVAIFILSYFYLSVQAIESDSQLFECSNKIYLISQYLNETTLKHELTCISQNFSPINLQGKLSFIQMTFSDRLQQQLRIPLLLTSYDWSKENSHILTIYSNNPFNNDQIKSSQLNFDKNSENPFEDITIHLTIDQALLQQLLPQLKIVRDTLVQFDFNDPSFYASYFKQSIQHIWYLIGFGYGVTVFLVINYFVRSFFTNKSEQEDHGQMISHYLALASPAFVVYPIKAEVLSFCYGFMGLNFPWMNDFFGSLLANPLDKSPSLMKIFYTNLNIASTYIIPLGVILLLILIGIILISICEQIDRQKQLSKAILYNFLYNIFSYGAITASIWAILGSFMNNLDQIFSFNNIMNSSFYIAGWLMLILIVVDIVHSLCKYANKHFYKLRNFVKIGFIALSNFSPVYFYGVMMVMNVLFVAGEFFISKKQNPKASPRIWIIKNILLDTALMLLVFYQNKIIAIFISMGLVGICILLQIYQHLQFRGSSSRKIKQSKENYNKAATHTVLTEQNETNKPKELGNIWMIDGEILDQPSKAQNNLTQHSFLPQQTIKPPNSSNKVAQTIAMTPPQTNLAQEKPLVKVSRRRRERHNSSTPIIVASNSQNTNKDQSQENILNTKNPSRFNEREDVVQKISDF